MGIFFFIRVHFKFNKKNYGEKTVLNEKQTFYDENTILMDVKKIRYDKNVNVFSCVFFNEALCNESFYSGKKTMLFNEMAAFMCLFSPLNKSTLSHSIMQETIFNQVRFG